jgi:hypothetical protein
MPDEAFLAQWCARYLGSQPVGHLFASGHLSQVAGVELADGRQVVIKIRPADPRIAGCFAVQEHLAQAGYPCPAPLAGPVQDGGSVITAETYVPGGTQLPAASGAAPFAQLLARLVRSAPDPSAVSSLEPSPPWTAWDHSGKQLWPDQDDTGRDLNAYPGPIWVDDAARRVRDRLTAAAASTLIGHGDWESQNIRWTAHQPLAVHDWDSVIAQPETAIVGLAAAVWPAAGAPGEAATVPQSHDFIQSYQLAAGRQWTAQEIRDAWAAGLWVRLFNAKKDAADGGGMQLDRLADEIADRLTLAGLDN